MKSGMHKNDDQLISNADENNDVAALLCLLSFRLLKPYFETANQPNRDSIISIKLIKIHQLLEMIDFSFETF